MDEIPRYEFQVSWRHTDANHHLGNAGFLDYATDCRFKYLASKGFPPSEMERLGIGPAVLNDNISYFRELRHMDRFSVTLALGGVNAKQTRFVFVNRFAHEDGTERAVLRSMFLWFSRTERKAISPPERLLNAILDLPRDAEFQTL